MARKRIPFVVLLMACVSAFGETRVYRSVVDRDTIVHVVEFSPSAAGYAWHITITRGSHTETDSIREDSARTTRRWRYSYTKGERIFVATRMGGQIHLKGTQKGKSVEKVYQIDERPWRQFFPFELEPFVLSGEEEHEFWAVGTMGPGNLKCGKFTARKRGEGIVRVLGEEVEAVLVRVAMSGWKSRFWHADFWFRKTDGRYVIMEGKDGPGELVEISTDE